MCIQFKEGSCDGPEEKEEGLTPRQTNSEQRSQGPQGTEGGEVILNRLSMDTFTDVCTLSMYVGVIVVGLGSAFWIGLATRTNAII